MRPFCRFYLILSLSMFWLGGAGLSISSGQVTPPEEFFGYQPGADFHLMTYEKALEYFELIAGETERMIVQDMGETSMGRRMKYAVISSEDNMAQLEKYKDINKRLSLFSDLSEREARRLAEQGRSIVWIDGGLHASECAPAQLLPQLAYDLVTDNDLRTRAIRENVIALIVFANPDGMTIVSDWYMDNVGTPFETTGPPWLYHKYAGHDNNRDSFMSNLIETQNMNRATSQEWFPEILYNQHQTAPFPARIWMPPDAEPTNPNVHPLLIRWRNLIGSAMGKAFEEAEQPGAISRTGFDSWYPGYCTQVVDSHNCVSILTETALYSYGTPKFYSLSEFSSGHQDLVPGVFYPSPWEGGWWRLGDAVAYNSTACKSILEVGAKFRYELLYDKYVMARDTVERFQSEPPYGWIIPPDQRDPGTTALLIERMLINGVDIYTADEEFTHNGITYPTDTYIIPTSQPYGLFAKNVMEKQDYPDLRQYTHLWHGLVSAPPLAEGPLRPYDGVGWTLPLQMGIEYKDMTDTLAGVRKTKIGGPLKSDGNITGGSGDCIVFTHGDNNSFKALNQLLDSGVEVSWATEEFTANDKEYPAGTFIIETNRVTRDLRRIASENGIAMERCDADVETKTLRKPRLALFMSWSASADAGWIMYILDLFGYDYHQLRNAEVTAGNLHDRFDVIILPSQGASSIINGRRKGTTRPDYVGGIGDEGVENLKTFVENGGTLICNASSTGLAIDKFKLPVKTVSTGRGGEFMCPGSILKMNYDISHPLAYGMPEKGTMFFSGARVFEPDPQAEPKEEPAEDPQTTQQAQQAGAGQRRGQRRIQETQQREIKDVPEDKLPKVVCTFPDEPLLLSGWMVGDERIRTKAGVLDAPLGEGKIALFGFNVHNRSQAYLTIKMFFNALYY